MEDDCNNGMGDVRQEASSSGTVVLTETHPDTVTQPHLYLRLQPDERREVRWTPDTVDNEHMGRKKSKCCCIYNKPKAWNESSSENESDKECDHCHGHVEKKKKKAKSNGHCPHHNNHGDSNENLPNSEDNSHVASSP